MKAAFYTLGCKVNQYETQIMEQALAGAGYEIVGHDEQADIYILNSCTVTGESDRKTRQLLRRFKKLNPDSIVVLTGCFPQSFPEKAAAIQEADAVTGVLGRASVGSLIERVLRAGCRIVDIPGFGQDEPFEPMSAKGLNGHTRAFVKIEDGCRSFCSYCIVPYSRGPVRSKTPDDLKQELMSLSKSGYREAVLVGINLSAYGTGKAFSLADAVETAETVPGIERIRLGSLEPNIITLEFIKRLQACEKFCHHFHLSLQSGCTDTLRRMNRRYTPGQYEEAVAALREAFPYCGITTDIIVGFPGETEDEFSQSSAFVRKIGFSHAHIFGYSRRDGTPAAEMPGQIPNAIREKRSREMAAVCAQSKALYLQKLVGQTMSVLFESYDDGYCGGFTPGYAAVRVNSSLSLQGKILPVLITGSDGLQCEGLLNI